MTATLSPQVMSPPRGGRGVARYVVVALAAIVVLTLVFSAQAIMRAGVLGGRVVWWRELATNALDWTVWAVLTPIIALVTRRYRLDASGPRARRLAVWIAAGLGCSVASAVLTSPVVYQVGLRLPPGVVPPSYPTFLAMWVLQTLGWNLVTFSMIAGVLHAVLYYRDLRSREMREADLQARLAQSELNALRTQLQPHFFFNALHTVSALMVSDVPAAHRVLAALSDLLRASVDHTAPQEIPLRDELAFVNRYVEIQRARFRDRLTVHTDVADEVLDALVPSLVLQPLVDNAIRHGIEVHRRRGEIWIAAARENGAVILSVRDNASPPNAPSPATSRGSRPLFARSGVGLANIEARLAQLYGPAQRFSAGRDTEGHFTVTLRLPYHTQSERLASHEGIG